MLVLRIFTHEHQSEGRNGLLNSLRVCWWNGPFLLVEWTVFVGGLVEWTVLEGVGCDRRVLLLVVARRLAGWLADSEPSNGRFSGP